MEKFKRYPAEILVDYYLSQKEQYDPNYTSEPHIIVNLKPWWGVKWIPDCCGGYIVEENLTYKEAEGRAERYETIAKSKSWNGRAEIILLK